MYFEEEENECDIKLKLPTMICDKSLGSSIPPPFPSSHHFMVICGGPGQGKTSFALGTYFNTHGPLRKKFNNVYIVVPPTSRGSVKDDPFKDHNPKKMSDELSLEFLHKVHTQGEVNPILKTPQNTLLYLDDVGAELKNKNIQKKLKQIIWNRRHLRTSIVMLCQNYKSLSLDLRKTISHLVCFKPSNLSEWGAIGSELLAIPKNQMQDLYDSVYQEPHDLLFAETNTGILHRNFNKLNIIEY